VIIFIANEKNKLKFLNAVITAGWLYNKTPIDMTIVAMSGLDIFIKYTGRVIPIFFIVIIIHNEQMKM